MSTNKTKDDPRPLQAIAPPEHEEGETEWSGFQPASKFSRQGSLPYDRNEYWNSFTRSGNPE
jgi:hypothetical protein